MRKNLENAIKHRFDELAYNFPDEVDADGDFRVRAMLDFFGDVKGKRILDVGCGKGRFARVMSHKGAVVTGLDLSGSLLLEAQRIGVGVFLQGSATALPFSDATFDCVFSVEVIEHVPDVEKAVAEMARVLKKGGKIMIIDKNKLAILRAVWKKYREIFNKWMYPKGFPFTERWFYPWEVKRMLARYCRKTSICYLGENVEDSNKLSYRIAIGASCILQRCFPPLTYYLAWKGQR